MIFENDGFDRDYINGYDPDTLRRLEAIRVDGAGRIGALAPELVVTRQRVLGARTHLNTRIGISQGAHADQREWETSVGAQSVRFTGWKHLGVIVLLVAGGVAETYFAFNGVRYGAGSLGAIKSPFDDPLALFGAAVIGGFSVFAAHLAGTSFAQSERSVMHEPIPADLATSLSTPLGVRSDPNDAAMHETSPVADLEQVLAGESDRVDVPVDSAIPASREVRNEERQHHLAVFRTARSKNTYRRIGIALVLMGLALWAVNGSLRGAYLDALPAKSGPTSSGMVAPSADAPKSASAGGHELEIIGLSMLIFLLSGAVVFAAHTPLELRGKELRLRAKDAHKNVLKALKSTEQAIRDFEQARAAHDLASVTAIATGNTARVPEDA